MISAANPLIDGCTVIGTSVLFKDRAIDSLSSSRKAMTTTAENLLPLWLVTMSGKTYVYGYQVVPPSTISASAIIPFSPSTLPSGSWMLINASTSSDEYGQSIRTPIKSLVN